MSEERRILEAGVPLEDAISLCHALRREGSLSDFASRLETECRNRRLCRCGGKGTCPDCPNRNR